MVHTAAAPTRRERRRAERVEAFRDAAVALIARAGLPALTIPALAREVDAAVGAIYRYYPSKEALLADLQCRFLGDLARWFDALDAGLAPKLGRVSKQVAVLTRIVAAAEFYAQLPAVLPGRFDLVASAVGDPRTIVPTELATPVVEAAAPLFAKIASLFSEGTENDALAGEDFATRAVVFWASLHGVVQIRKLARVSDALDNAPLCDALVFTLLIGWGADPKMVKRAAQRAQRHLDDGTIIRSIVEERS